MPVVEVENLELKLDGLTVLEDIDLTIEQGAFVAILGPNGGGKSCLFRVLLGLLKPTGGRVRVFGERPGRAGRRIGYMPQYKRFDRRFPGRGIEVLVAALRGAWPFWVREAERNQAREALDRVGASEELLDRQLSALSGGELQRVFLARALIGKPDLVLLDEPTAAVDARGHEEMLEIMESLAAEKETTVCHVTHDYAQAEQLADEALILDRRILARGVPDERLHGQLADMQEKDHEVTHRHRSKQ